MRGEEGKAEKRGGGLGGDIAAAAVARCVANACVASMVGELRGRSLRVTRFQSSHRKVRLHGKIDLPACQSECKGLEWTYVLGSIPGSTPHRVVCTIRIIDYPRTMAARPPTDRFDSPSLLSLSSPDNLHVPGL